MAPRWIVAPSWGHDGAVWRRHDGATMASKFDETLAGKRFIQNCSVPMILHKTLARKRFNESWRHRGATMAPYGAATMRPRWRRFR
eukprot:gene14475-biopygen3626